MHSHFSPNRSDSFGYRSNLPIDSIGSPTIEFSVSTNSILADEDVVNLGFHGAVQTNASATDFEREELKYNGTRQLDPSQLSGFEMMKQKSLALNQSTPLSGRQNGWNRHEPMHEGSPSFENLTNLPHHNFIEGQFSRSRSGEGGVFVPSRDKASTTNSLQEHRPNPSSMSPDNRNGLGPSRNHSVYQSAVGNSPQINNQQPQTKNGTSAKQPLYDVNSMSDDELRNRELFLMRQELVSLRAETLQLKRNESQILEENQQLNSYNNSLLEENKRMNSNNSLLEEKIKQLNTNNQQLVQEIERLNSLLKDRDANVNPQLKPQICKSMQTDPLKELDRVAESPVREAGGSKIKRDGPVQHQCKCTESTKKSHSATSDLSPVSQEEPLSNEASTGQQRQSQSLDDASVENESRDHDDRDHRVPLTNATSADVLDQINVNSTSNNTLVHSKNMYPNFDITRHLPGPNYPQVEQCDLDKAELLSHDDLVYCVKTVLAVAVIRLDENYEASLYRQRRFISIASRFVKLVHSFTFPLRLDISCSSWFEGRMLDSEGKVDEDMVGLQHMLNELLRVIQIVMDERRELVSKQKPRGS
ncbi:hypothetical protein KGF57_001152 [Candida theae]|uniref:Uncharacterized protein n=1 Tax=Candida theae TaxID=1198502 RepID=A0AAD5BHG5_9ASCO|nr:uncharacterized protein KGF57_001152 [Candida theae]KAI5963877.1 hypothetical protein KGF57_001152 [Candida theae]